MVVDGGVGVGFDIALNASPVSECDPLPVLFVALISCRSESGLNVELGTRDLGDTPDAGGSIAEGPSDPLLDTPSLSLIEVPPGVIPPGVIIAGEVMI